MPTREELEAGQKQYDRMSDVKGDRRAKRLPPLKSFRDLATIKERLINEEDTQALREAVPISHPDADPALRIDGARGGTLGGTITGNDGLLRAGLPDAAGRNGEASGRSGRSPFGHAEGEDRPGARAAAQSAGRSNVEGVDLTLHNVAYYVHEWLRDTFKQTPNQRFHRNHVADALGLTGQEKEAVSAALSRCAQAGALRLVEKEVTLYIYEVIDIDLLLPNRTGPRVRGYSSPHQPGRKRPTRLDASLPPKTSVTGRLSREDIPMRTYGETGQGETRFHTPSPEDVVVSDYSDLERRVLSHLSADYAELQTLIARELPATLRQMGGLARQMRRELLSEFTVNELLAEIKERTK